MMGMISGMLFVGEILLRTGKALKTHKSGTLQGMLIVFCTSIRSCRCWLFLGDDRSFESGG